MTAPASDPASAAGGGRFQGQFATGNGQGQAGNGQPGNGQGQGGPGGFFGAGGGITISGEVTAVSADQLTLKLASGQTITVPLDGSTTYHSQAPATAAGRDHGQHRPGPGRSRLAAGNGSPGTGGSGRRNGQGGRLHPRGRDERDGRPEVTLDPLGESPAGRARPGRDG